MGCQYMAGPDEYFTANTKGFSYVRFATENGIETSNEFWDFQKAYYKANTDQQVELCKNPHAEEYCAKFWCIFRLATATRNLQKA